MTSAEHEYAGLRQALELGAEDVVACLEKAGQEEIAGGGRLVAGAWQRCSTAEGEEKYVVCNAVDAGLPGGIAKIVLDRDAHTVLEGLLIAAQAVGATQAYVCVNAGDAEQVAMVKAAVEQIKEQRQLDRAVPSADFACEITVVPVPVSLVLREDTALLRVLEGRQAIPYLSAPDPGVRRLRGRPTVVHGAETLAHIAALFREFSQGPGAGATRLLIVRQRDDTRVVEVPLGTTLRTVVQEMVGFDPGGDQIEAVRFGGPTGRFLAGPSLDIAVGYGETGILEVIGPGACGVEVACRAMRYLSEESCGACVACREGTRQLADMLDDIAAFEAEADRMELLAEVAEALAEGSICSIGEGAAAMLLSSVEAFPQDYRAHLDDKHCLGDESRA